ncbi:hypothetical protein [Bradyrhizobium sp. STM 3562]|uniref:hypothetical protein n=1 Tax=Bradyrhizobium sp. STM 3562 TaxID=578924 RepID=UPI0038902E50
MIVNKDSPVTGSLSERAALVLLIAVHIVLCCVSLVYLSRNYSGYHIYFDPALRSGAIAVVAAFSILSLLFVRFPFSFGYLVGFYFYTMVTGYLWLNCFSDFNYNHSLSGASAAAAMVTFLIPALFISRPIHGSSIIGAATFDRLLTAILVAGVLTVLVGAGYNFKLVSLAQMYEFRSKLSMPGMLNYAIGIVSNALLPFAFACFAVRRNYWRAVLTLAVLVFFYPITLNKVALFTPVWLLIIAILSRLFGCRITTVISLLLPLTAGTIAYTTLGQSARFFFELINLRMVATPSNAMDVYNDFFFHHPYTYFCQINLLKMIVSCPYQDQLGVVMNQAYPGFGNFNASLFSTEGIASVGPLFAPLSVLLCGLVIGFANRLSAGLPLRLVLISSSVLGQLLLNVPLTTTLLSHGAALLFLLWYITPRGMLPEQASLLGPALVPEFSQRK